MNDVTFRLADKNDAATILHFIRELAEYEKLLHEVEANVTDIENSVFDGSGRSFCYIAEINNEPVGFCLCFYNYSTFQGKYGIYIEDVYVTPEHRNKGIGKKFFSVICQKALDENCGRVQWWVLDWNEPSIAFYKKIGATAMDEWTVFRLEGNAIKNVAEL